MDSELINCMDMLEEELEESKKALFSSSFKKVDTERMYEILDDAGCGRVFGRIHRYGEEKQRIPIRQRRNTKTCGLTVRLFFTLFKR